MYVNCTDKNITSALASLLGYNIRIWFYYITMKPGQDVHQLAPPTHRIDQMRFIYLMATWKCFSVRQAYAAVVVSGVRLLDNQTVAAASIVVIQNFAATVE